jgi:hypothetical protein
VGWVVLSRIAICWAASGRQTAASSLLRAAAAAHQISLVAEPQVPTFLENVIHLLGSQTSDRSIPRFSSEVLFSSRHKNTSERNLGVFFSFFFCFSKMLNRFIA